MKKLFMFSAARCMNPSCKRLLVADSNGYSEPVDKICHIHSEKENGPRYVSGLTVDQLRDYSNLVVLCDDCHTLIDRNPDGFPSELLCSWREKCAEQILHAQSSKASQLSAIVCALARIDFDDNDALPLSKPSVPYAVDSKIDFNNLKTYEFVIRHYKDYCGKLQSLYAVLEEQSAFSKSNLLRLVSLQYLQSLGTFKKEGDITKADIARKNADAIFEEIQRELSDRVVLEVGNTIPYEDIEFGVLLIMVDAFMNCKILEPPPDDY